MIQKIDHVGIVVENTEEVVLLLSNLFGFKISESLMLSEEGFRSTLISKKDVTIELIEPIGSEGIIQNFIKKHGWGLHHISIQVDDLEREMESLKGKGVRLIDKEPRQVTESSKVAFIHPNSIKGILIELIHRAQS